MKSYYKNLLVVGLTGLLLSACSDKDSNSAPATVEAGVFLDSAVLGISYETETQSGNTDANGTYNYVEGETVTFSIGDITLPSAKASAKLSPHELTASITDPTLRAQTKTNLARLLQTLDEDDDPTNGITLSEATLQAGIGKSIDFSAVDATAFESAAAALLTDIGGKPLISEADANEHLETTLIAEGIIITVDSGFTQAYLAGKTLYWVFSGGEIDNPEPAKTVSMEFISNTLVIFGGRDVPYSVEDDGSITIEVDPFIPATLTVDASPAVVDRFTITAVSEESLSIVHSNVSGDPITPANESIFYTKADADLHLASLLASL